MFKMDSVDYKALSFVVIAATIGLEYFIEYLNPEAPIWIIMILGGAGALWLWIIGRGLRKEEDARRLKAQSK